MEIEAVHQLFSEDLQAVERELDRNIQSQVALIPTVGKYILNSGGKRFRPLILIASARCCGYRGKEHISLACILEFIHTATLLHDDVVDDAKIRRGNSSVNSIWGNHASILVGDFFFARSFSLVPVIRDWRILEVLTESTIKLAQGEILELLKEGDTSCDEEGYLSVIVHKTASLIEAATQIGAILGKADPGKELAMKRFGHNLGIAFQIMDDTLDYIAREDVFGKTIGKDLIEGKITLPLIYALNHCEPKEREEATAILGLEEIREQDLAAILVLINRYRGLEYAFQRAQDFADLAKEALSEFDASSEKQSLLSLADYVLERRC